MRIPEDRNDNNLIRERRRELRTQIEELRQQYHEELYGMSHLEEQKRGRRQYRYYRRHIHYGRPIAMLFMLAFWIALFMFGGFSLWLSLVIATLALLSTVSGIMELLFLFRMDRRIFIPLDNLENAVREIARGNYDVEVPGPFHPETAALVKTFNLMAKALKENEILKKAYEENRKGLVANISHDLKTPVTSVLGYIDAIADIGAVNPEKIGKYLAIIKSNTIYINKLIDDLFLFSRLDIDRLDFAFETVNIRSYLRDLMEEFSLDFNEKRIRFTYEDRFADAALAQPVSAEIDPKLFSRILRNLFDNAQKYGPEEGLCIEVAAGITDAVKSAPDAESFFISIADNGPGLPEAAMQHLFERFFRADAERTKAISSTGLGLAIARELTEAHGGRIAARNKTGGGLLFTIEIPIIDSGERQ